MSRPWTPKDDDRLLELAGSHSATEIAKIMGRAYCTVYRNAARLKARMKKQKDTARMTDNQIDFIMLSYPALSFGEISRRLGKPLSSVTWRYKKEKEKEAKRTAAKKAREALENKRERKNQEHEARRFPRTKYGYSGRIKANI